MLTNKRDILLKLSCSLAALISAALIIAIFFFLFSKSTHALSEIGIARFFSDKFWSPEADASSGYFDIRPMLYGSLLVSVIALFIAVPMALLSSTAISFYTSERTSKLLEQAFAVFAGIPSVVLGFWGLVSISPMIAKIDGAGPSLLTGAIVLSIMVLPTLVLTTIAAIRTADPKLLSSSLSLGMSKISCILKVILPSIRSTIFAGVILSLMRAIGETMVVTMLCGNIAKSPKNIFSPVRTLTSNIALEMAYAYDVHRSALFTSGLILLIICTILVMFAQLLRSGENEKR